LKYVDEIRAALAYGIAAAHLTLGRPAVAHWLEIMERSPQQRAPAAYLRSAVAIYEGDSAAAERQRKQAEILSVQLSATQMFGSPLQIELTARVFDRDLAGVRRVSDQIAQLAAEEPGWIAQQHLAEGFYQQLRGNLPAAVAAFERSFALNHPGQTDPPPCFNTWAFAARGFMAALVELDRAEEARRFGLRACECCRAQETSWIDVVECELALAEASVGDFASAATRLDALIERNLDKTLARLSWLYEARARVAIRARDGAAARQYAELATRDFQGGPGHRVLQRHARMLEEARRAGIDLELAQSGFEDTVLGGPRSNDRSVVGARALREVQRVAPNARPQRILEMVCEAAEARAGKLFLAHGELLTRVASTGEASEPALDTFASGYFRQQLEIAFETNAVTEITAGVTSEPTVGSWTSPRGTQYRFIALTQIVDGELALSGLVALELAPSRPIPPHTHILARALAPELAACAG
jgi:tetratricopeptide (TPR) repeat protein